MGSNKVGTNYYTDTGDTGVQVSFSDAAGFALDCKATTANIPSAKAGYQVGCVLHNLTSGSLMVNTGTTASCTFVSVSQAFGV